MIAKALKACVQDHMGGLRAMNYELWSITRMQPWELGKYSFGDSKEEKKKTKNIPDLGKHTVDSKFGCNDNLQTSEKEVW